MLRSRRSLLRDLAGIAACAPLLQSVALGEFSGQSSGRPGAPQTHAPSQRTAADEALLDEIEHRAFLFFWEASDPITGLTKDRNLATTSNDPRDIASIAANGFGLTTLTIADKRGWMKTPQLVERVRATLRFFNDHAYQQRGFFYHFMRMHSGKRAFKCEVSTIDTSLLLCGILACRAHFDDKEIRSLATQIYQRADWTWFLNGGKMLSMGWKPETGFYAAQWDHYCELMMIYLLGLGSPTHPLSADSWDVRTRPVYEYKGLKYITGPDPIFTHQYSHAWFDFRRKRDRHSNYFQNSITATLAHKLFCLSLHDRFPDYTENLWGITSSDSVHGYVAWGGPPPIGPIDGSVVPCAAGGSVAFLPSETLPVLHNMRDKYGDRAWTRYGFVDAFNPLTNWYDADVLGIDLGIMALMAENLRSGFVWETFMQDKDAQRGLERAGFHPDT
jgi:hypothetical protein